MSALAGLVTGIAHVGIRVHDLERSRRFYEILGFDFIAGPLGPEPVAILRHRSGVVINFILNAGEGAAPNVLMDLPQKHAGYTHIALEVTSLADAQRALGEAGIELSGGPITFPDGTRAVFVRDPDRNVIEFDELPRAS